MARTDRPGVPLGYRIGWLLRYAAVSVFGPARLGAEDDPQMKLRREKQQRLDSLATPQ